MDFIKELEKLRLKTPRVGAVHFKVVNCEFTYNVDECKNCYLIANAVGNEDCMYGRDFYGNKDCVDCDHIRDCTLCYFLVNCRRLYNCDFCQQCNGCSDCKYGYDLKNCRNCIGCAGLRNKDFYIFNKSYTPEEYRKKLGQLSPEEIWSGFEKVKLKAPRVYAVQLNSENFTGDCVYHCQNAYECFDTVECQDVGYVVEGKDLKDCYDITVLEHAVLCYEISSAHKMNNCNFCFLCANASDCEYSECLFDCEHCFGCISLHHKKFHILNKPYEEEEYFKKITKLRSEAWYGREFLTSTYDFEDTVAVWPVM